MIKAMPAAEYHAIKALSAGLIWTMNNECPLKAWLDSPWNPNRVPLNANHFDLGTALHLAVLESEEFRQRTTIVRGLTKKGEPSQGYVSADAKAQRDAAYAAGVTPLLDEEMGVIDAMRCAILSHPIARDLLCAGAPELSIEWEWSGLPCKCRPDYLADDRSYILDLKTTTTVNPRVIARKAFNEGWHVRAAWYEAGVASIADGVLPKRYLFIVAEVKPPHLVEIFELDERALLFGDKLIQKEMERAAECLQSDRWPSYGNGFINKLVLPSWQMAERMEELEP